MILVTCNVDFL